MVITRITKKNELLFNYLFPKEAEGPGPDLIRLGVISDDGKGVGTLSARVYGTEVFIISLFILEAYRRQGYGRALMEWLINFLKDEGIEVLNTEFYSDRASEAFAEAMGFELFEMRPIYTFLLGEVFRSPLYKKHIEGKKVYKVKPVSALSTAKRKIFEKSVGGREFDPDWSTAVITRGKCTSSLLITHGKQDVSFVFINSINNNLRELLYHIRALVFKTIEEFPDRRDIEFRLTILDERRVDNLAGLLGGRRHIHKAGYFRHAVKMLV